MDNIDMLAKLYAKPVYQERVQFMPLGEIKKLFKANGLDQNIKLCPEDLLKACELLESES